MVHKMKSSHQGYQNASAGERRHERLAFEFKKKEPFLSEMFSVLELIVNWMII